MVNSLCALDDRVARSDANLSRRGRAVLKFAAALSLLAVSGPIQPAHVLAQQSSEAAGSEAPGEAAIRRLAEGNYAAAAQNLRRAMEVTPDDPILNIAAGAVAVSTGDADTARS